MDDVKDIAKKDDLAKVLDSTPIRTDAFGHNIFAERAYRRAERIAAAIHLVTNHIPEIEPIRAVSRSTALDLIVGALSLRDVLRSSEPHELILVQGIVRKAISHMRILSVSGRISMHNAEALIAALDDLGASLIVSQRSHLSEAVSLTRDTFAVEGGSSGAVIKDIGVRTRARRIKDKVSAREPGLNAAESLRARSEEIVGLLAAQGQLGIKDIAAGLPTYSEKMVQRELKRLVELGRVRKIGAKRWSMYALAKQ